MKELKIDESVKLKLEPGVCVQIVAPQHCGVEIKDASYCNVDITKGTALNVCGNDLTGVDLKLSRSKDIDVAAYGTEFRVARQ